MCFSFEASVAALLVGTISSICVFLLGGPFDKIIGIWFFFISLMQGIEALLWKHQTCDDFHKNVTYLGSSLNSSQPLVLALLCYIYSKQANPIALLVIVALYLIYGLQIYFRNHPESYFCSNPKSGDPHLVWKWTVTDNYLMDWLVYLIALCLLCVYGLNKIRAFLLGGSIITSLVLTYWLYPRESVGSVWCFFTALTPPIYLALRKLGYI